MPGSVVPLPIFVFFLHFQMARHIKQFFQNGFQGSLILKSSLLGLNGSKNHKLWWGDLGDDENAVKAGKVMDMEENQTSLLQKQAFWSQSKSINLSTKIKPTIQQEICPFYIILQTTVVFSDTEQCQNREILDFPVLRIFPGDMRVKS